MRKTLFVKTQDDCEINGRVVSITLTQEETFKFSHMYPGFAELRALTNGGKCLGTKLMAFTVEKSHDDEVMV